jgi:PEP-CTERM motif
MKRNTTLAIAAILVIIAASATSAFAQSITVDEFGSGVFSLPTGSSPLTGAIAVDPVSGVATMAYMLPFPVNPGDVLLLEPPNTPFSDLLRFGGPNHNILYFFSDVSTADPADSPADVGIPAPQSTSTVISESGAEGSNGATWLPGAAGIGGTSSLPTLTYTFISDVPEPSSLLLAALGVSGLLLSVRRRRCLGTV